MHRLTHLRQMAVIGLALAILAGSTGQLFPPGPTAPLYPPGPTRQA